MATALTNAELQEQQRRLTVFQDRYDEVLQPWGRRAPVPVLTQTPGQYRREALIHAQTFLPENDQWRKVPPVEFTRMDVDTLRVVEAQILDALRTAAQHPASVASSAAGRPDSIDPNLRVVESYDSNGLKMRTFHGANTKEPNQDCFTRQFTRPCRRVKSFLFDKSALRG
jgi:hypothetical protein